MKTRPVKVGTFQIGAKKILIIAGPCAVESEKQMDSIATSLKNLGINFLRAGAFKPRSGPHSFQGLGEKGLEILSKTAKKHNLRTVTEVLDPRDVELVATHTDILQIGARNMQNYALLKEVGKTQKPVILKRGLCATVEEFLLAAEYIFSKGNKKIILCERGIRTFEKDVRNTLALATVPRVKELSHLPIIVDPSHGTGQPSLIPAMSKAAIACGADGLMIEVHPNPKKALSDGKQSLTPIEFKKLLQEIKPIAKAVGKTT